MVVFFLSAIIFTVRLIGSLNNFDKTSKKIRFDYEAFRKIWISIS